MLEEADPTEPGIPSGSMEFFALAMDPSEVQDFERRASEMGASIEHRTAQTLYLRDPDGRRVGVSHHPFVWG